MLWLCLHFPLLPRAALGIEQDDAVVVDQHGSQRWLITGTPSCEAGMAMTQAMSLFPELTCKVRKPAAEHRLLESLAHWLYRFGQPVAAQIQDLSEPGRLPRALLWVEIGQSLKLFGNLPTLREQICQELIEMGHVAQIGIAPTRTAAALRACAGQNEPLQQAESLTDALAPLPIHVLHWPSRTLDALSGVGLRTLKDLFAIPREAFSKRFGTDRRRQLDQLLGQAAEPFDAIVPPESFRRRLELPAETENTGHLQFPLRRLCGELQGYLRARDRGLCSVMLDVGHAGARCTRIHARFVDPHRDINRIFNALQERLERDGLPMAARELVLIAEEFDEPAIAQNDFFDNSASQQQAWHAAVERIRARLGEERVWVPRAHEDHRPEYASLQITGTGPENNCSAKRAASPHTQNMPADRPTLLLDAPWPMPPPELSFEPRFERIEAGWWDDHDVRRDYLSIDINGGRAWVFRDLESGQWFLHGWWA